MKEYGTIGEKADTYFMKGIEKEEYSLVQAKSDSIKYCHKEETLTDLLSSLDKPEKQKPFYVKVPLELDTEGNQIRYPLTDKE